ncbi:putative baseplate assembly protein [Edaphobacter sp. HDX4]|uniref:putative baseplate assembly protein n=1 Tax=Edaphobacter sp. HDX4 TaxID=2794064 RepID=UPI002FE69DA4
MKPAGICNDEQRRLKVRSQDFNGIDYVEAGHDAPSNSLDIYFFGKAPDALSTEHIVIDGGVRIAGIQATSVHLYKINDPEQEDRARITLNKAGDFSTYTLRIVGLPGFDPVYSSFDFLFRPDCPADLDCLDQNVCAPRVRDEPEIDYLAKDYQGFRQLILDRWSLLMPEWKETRVPDIGIALAEILAYTGDYLSYYQDAVATEAYIGTCRQRISLRRHARLVDYFVHEGCNARALVCVETLTDTAELNPNDFYFVTNAPVAGKGSMLTQQEMDVVSAGLYEVFEPVAAQPVRFYESQNRMAFYTWGYRQCSLEKGAVNATLIDHWTPESTSPAVTVEAEDGDSSYLKAAQSSGYRKTPEGNWAKPASPHTPKTRQTGWGSKASGHDEMPAYQGPRARMLDGLQPGDILILAEVLGPKTGVESDADPLHRQAVRIVRTERAVDELYQQPIVNIWWHLEDALAFPLCISCLGRPPECRYIEKVSVALGNVLLVDHGRRITNDPLVGWVPLQESVASCIGVDEPSDKIQLPGIFRPVLKAGPMTYCQSPLANAPASKLTLQDPRQAIPWITLQMVTLTGVWDLTLKTTAGEDSALLIFRQLQGELDGSYSGKLGNLTICGSIEGVNASWNLLSLPATDALAAFSATFSDGVLEGTFKMDTSGTFRAVKRLKDQPWIPRPDLLSSGPNDNHFVVEMEDGYAHLRFGDGQLGRAPEAGATFLASYRIGNGSAANFGPDTITHIVSRQHINGQSISRISNPLAASGGTAPESFNDVKLFAPSAFRSTLERAVTAEDYATIAQRHPKVQRAAASLRFTGSRYSVQLAIDPFGTEVAAPDLLEEIKRSLYRYRRIDHDIEIVPANYVPLLIEMTVCVRPGYLKAHVKAALIEVLGSTSLPDGRRGFFHPDNLTFGVSIYLSHLIAIAQAVTGVMSIRVDKLERLYQGPNGELQNGVLPIGPLEIARLDRNPNFPESGVLKLNMGGGR